MKNLIDFPIISSEYSVKQLLPKDAKVFQGLYDRCTDFALLTDGVAFSLTAAREEFEIVPPGKTTQDVYIFGLFDPCNILSGAIASLRHYPDNRTWWLGLMMLAPEHRSRGLGTDFYRGFERWVSMQDVTQISLCVIEANNLGLRFWQKMGFEITRKTPPRQYGIKIHELYVLSRNLNEVLPTAA